MFGFFESKDAKRLTEITVSNRTVIRVLVLVVLTFIGFAALRQASHSLMLIFTALFLALALNAPVQWLARRLPGKRKGSRTLATALSFIVIVAFLVGFMASLVPPIVRQTNNFIASAPALIDQARNEDSPAGKFIKKYNLQDDVSKLSSQLTDRLKGATGTAVTTAGKIGSSVFALLAVLALTFMMLIEGPRWISLFQRMIPLRHRGHASELSRDMYRVVKGYVNGQVILAAIAAVMLLPALVAVHVSYPVALMVVVFICGLIPMVGHTIGAAIVTTVAIFHSVPSAIIILAYYILYQQIENYIVQPRVQANTTNMSPLLVFASVIIGVNFGGLFGGLVAIPVAGCIRIAMLDYLTNRGVIDQKEKQAAENGKPIPSVIQS
jgi:predicted PurR-regulated permease PerM